MERRTPCDCPSPPGPPTSPAMLSLPDPRTKRNQSCPRARTRFIGHLASTFPRPMEARRLRSQRWGPRPCQPSRESQRACGPQASRSDRLHLSAKCGPRSLPEALGGRPRPARNAPQPNKWLPAGGPHLSAIFWPRFWALQQKANKRTSFRARKMGPTRGSPNGIGKPLIFALATHLRGDSGKPGRATDRG